MQIVNKYREKEDVMLLIDDRYYDFVLSKDKTASVPVDGSLTERNMCCFIDFTDSGVTSDSGVTFSSDASHTWGGAFNEGVQLTDIGLCGMDNGFIMFDKDEITPVEFYSILMNSRHDIDEGDYRLHLKRVDGITKYYSYGTDYETSEYLSLKGGFLQGFFNLKGFDYQVLPLYPQDEMHLEFVLRPRDYVVKDNILNKYNPDNQGIFFYVGTRSENKFAEMHYADLSSYPLRGGKREESMLEGYLETEGSVGVHGKTHDSGITYEIKDSEGDNIDIYPFVEIETDNKYLFFNRTEDGFTTDTWKEDSGHVFIQMNERDIKTNLYTLMNRTDSGYTTDTIHKYPIQDSERYDILKDIENNAFALKINEDMSVGYRYLTKDCDNAAGWSVKEERTFPNMIKKDEWNVVNVKVRVLDGQTDDCGNPTGVRTVKLYIYVNGYLKLVSQELPELQLRALDDKYTRQEGVPYNISIGGGTQGMCDSIWLKYKEVYPRILPLEDNFAGTFIGDIRSFKMYCGDMKYNEIKNNYIYESGK